MPPPPPGSMSLACVFSAQRRRPALLQRSHTSRVKTEAQSRHAAIRQDAECSGGACRAPRGGEAGCGRPPSHRRPADARWANRWGVERRRKKAAGATSCGDAAGTHAAARSSRVIGAAQLRRSCAYGRGAFAAERGRMERQRLDGRAHHHPRWAAPQLTSSIPPPPAHLRTNTHHSAMQVAKGVRPARTAPVPAAAAVARDRGGARTQRRSCRSSLRSRVFPPGSGIQGWPPGGGAFDMGHSHAWT
eukprot:359063-Chlamydomonas_euryale.AAC.1